MPLRNAVLSSQAPQIRRAAPRQNRAASPSGIMLSADVAAGMHASAFAAPAMRAAIYKVVGARAVAAVVRAHVCVVGGHAAARKAKEVRIAANVVRVVPGGPRRDQRLRRRHGADLQVGGRGRQGVPGRARRCGAGRRRVCAVVCRQVDQTPRVAVIFVPHPSVVARCRRWA